MRDTETLDMDSILKEENKSEEKGIEDVEEGEISDAASVEGISKDDFKKQETKVVKDSNSKLAKPESRVWTMSDLYKYQMKGGYVSGLYNLAWAQAVQNKPLTEIFAETETNRSDSLDASGKEGGVVDVDGGEVADGEKEEGELEEGEIDLDTDSGGKLNGEDRMYSNASKDWNLSAVKRNLNSIRGVLESVNGVEVEKSFEAICMNVEAAIGRLCQLVKENSSLNLNNDGVNQSLYNLVQRIISAYGCMSDDMKQQKKEIFSRFTAAVNNVEPRLFSPEQAKGIEVMISSVDSSDGLVNTKNLENKPGGNLINTVAEYNKSYISAEAPIVGVPSFRSRVNLLRPLIDLHKDHDEDSLPSPTRETTTTFPVHGVLMAGEGANLGFLTPKPVPSIQDPRPQFYANDALKAVSSYQQKFGRNSFFMTDRLPSPTPSEESGDGEGDTGGEVSSSSTVSNLKTVNPSVLVQPVASSPVVPEIRSMPAITPLNTLPVSAGPAASRSAVKSSAKSRDPRLRYVNSDVNSMDQSQHSLPIVNSVPFGQINNPKKQKNAEDTSVDGPVIKKQRNSLENGGVLREGISVTRSGLLLEDVDMVGPQVKNSNQANNDSDPRKVQNRDTSRGLSVSQEHIPVTGTNATAKVEQVALTSTGATSLTDLLKVLGVNPAVLNNPALMNNPALLNILKMGRQSLALDTMQRTADPARINGQLPSVNPVIGSGPASNVVTSQSQGILPKAAPLQFPSQISAPDERGKIRMKPRDPRRALHNTSIQRNGSLGSDQLKANINPASADQGIKENQIVQKQEGQTETKQASLKSVLESEITSAPQVSTSSSPAQNTMSASSNSDCETGTSIAVDVTAAAARSPNGWADVEHLFENYDDQQKAAIQRERTRRMDEQKKMFAQHKLCLVLDLDHTLLNSAKFVEVDPVHDEILRKKEEQDREKSFRHLFRFPHMGMWTKLRPGIWNFLEKASQLYELHLYTMGNKLYATEMAKLLDPKGALFAGRVISRGDDGDPFDSDDRVPKSKDLEGVLGMESSVVIIDDSVRVWPHNKLNLIVVERYIYFPCSRRQFGLPGPSLLEIDHDERPEDGTLASALAVIQKIHQNFFTHPSLDEIDVRSILASEQRKILDGCRIVFSRVFPVDEVKPHLHPLWQTAEQFGAVCTNQIDDQVTHVVANSLGTDKVNWALSKGRHVVYPGWVEASALLYRRANERDFAVK